MPFRIALRYIDEMIAHAREDAPNECCGVLLGQPGAVQRLVRCTNAEHSPFRYSVAPRELLEIDRQARENGWETLAIYHSHTQTEAYPSPTDVRLAAYPDALYILVSLRDEQNPTVRGFSIRDGRIDEASLDILDDGVAG